MAELLGDDEGMTMGMGDAGAAAPGAGMPRNPAYVELLAAWRSEVACPELLAWRGDLVDGLRAGADAQERLVDASVREGADVDECLFSAPMYQTEIARVKYVLGAYVRCRLRKLESMAGWVANDDEARARLSDREAQHCDAYLALCAKHHRKALLDELPAPFADETPEGEGDAVPEALAKACTRAPQLDGFVFVRARSDLGDVQIDPSGETAFFAKGDVHVLRYGPVRTFVHDGSLQLI